MRFVVVLTLLLFMSSTSLNSQDLTSKELKNLLDSVVEDEKFSRNCEKQALEAQIKKFGKPRPKITGHCWDGCPTSLPKPFYPEVARRNGLKGEVVVRAIADETGKVIYAKAVKGRGIFHQSAIWAAYSSTYSPKIFCDIPVKF